MHNIKVINSNHCVEFPDALAFMERKVQEIIASNEGGYLWFLEHPSIYTAGVTANENDLLACDRFPTYNVNRGGKYTYHGPGQRIIYTILNLKTLQAVPDIKKFIYSLEETIILTLKDFNITGERLAGKIGIWVHYKGKWLKIAAIGLRVKNWVTFHGISININPNLEHFTGIVPCGIKDAGITSFRELSINVNVDQIDKIFLKHFQQQFKVTTTKMKLDKK